MKRNGTKNKSKMNDKDIAIKVSEILGVQYSHHDLHYVDYELGGKHSLLTAYRGMSPYTFSILEDGRVWILTRPLLELLVELKDYAPEEQRSELEQYDKILEAENWLKENNAIECLKSNLSDFYKNVMNEEEK
jgi:hypothetical protein